jgi:hypothetical protein
VIPVETRNFFDTSQISVGNLSANACKFWAGQSNIAAVKPLRKISGIPFPLAIIIALALIYTCIFAGPMQLVLRAKRESANKPTQRIVPIPLSDRSISTAPGTKVISFGYQFDVTWRSEFKIREDTIAVAPSQSGEVIAGFMNPAKFQGVIKVLRQDLGSQFSYLGVSYGLQNIQSDYDALRATLYASPAHLSLFFPSRRQGYAATFLILKGGNDKRIGKRALLTRDWRLARI